MAKILKTVKNGLTPAQETAIRAQRNLPSRIVPVPPPTGVYSSFSIAYQELGDVRTFDGFENEDLSRSAEVTPHPVETGAKVSDHVVPSPASFTVTAVVNENMHELTGGQGWASTSGLARVREVYEWLDATLQNGTLVSIQTSFGLTLSDYVLQSYATTRSNRGMLAFQLVFSKIDFAFALMVDIQPLPRRGGAKAAKGPGKSASGGGVGLDGDLTTNQITLLQTAANAGFKYTTPKDALIAMASPILSAAFGPE